MIVYWDVQAEETETFNKWNTHSEEKVIQEFERLKLIPSLAEDILLVTVEEKHKM